MGDLVMRREVADTIPSEPPTDLTGWRMPRRFTAFTCLRSIPHLLRQFTTVPPEYWTQDINEDGYSEAVIACPCGREPHVEVGGLDQCDCERFFLFVGHKVLAANTPQHREAPNSSLGDRPAS